MRLVIPSHLPAEVRLPHRNRSKKEALLSDCKERLRPHGGDL